MIPFVSERRSLTYVEEVSRTKIKGNLLKLQLVRGVVYMDDNYIEYGYFPMTMSMDIISINRVPARILTHILNPKFCHYDNELGMYVYSTSPNNQPKQCLFKDPFTDIKYTLKKGFGIYPYSFPRNYEARDHFNLFNNMEKDYGDRKYLLGDFLSYTFGLEFETSMGFIPQGECFRYGLIPLRDGSISGLEYSTIVLDGNRGLSLLENQLKLLKCYTAFNKECSLHIHLGGFPLEPDKIFMLYKVIISLQNEFYSLLPNQTFTTAEYKKTGKDYCKLYDRDYNSFETFYQAMAKQKFYGSLTMPHPADIGRNRKWEINTRYYWVNFINMLCYSGGKTVEFRFLRPSFNFRFIYMWLWIFNAILLYAQNYPITSTKFKCTLCDILSVYPENIKEMLWNELNLYRVAVVNQHTNEDFCGRDVSFVEEVFSEPSPLL